MPIITIPLDDCMPCILGKYAEWEKGVCDGLDYFSEYFPTYTPKDLHSRRGHEFTLEQIKNDDDLRDCLERAALDLDQRADVDATYQSHRDMCDSAVQALSDHYEGACTMSIDWRKQELIIDIKDITKTGQAVLDIISAEGYFRIDTLKDWRDQGPYKTTLAAIRAHTHYLLDLPLIMGIWGNVSRHVFEYRECSGDVSPSDIRERMDEAKREYADIVEARNKAAMAHADRVRVATTAVNQYMPEANPDRGIVLSFIK